MSAENTTQAVTQAVTKEEEYMFPDYVTLKTGNGHEFIVQGKLLRHVGMYRKLFNKEIAAMMVQGWSKVNGATHTSIDIVGNYVTDEKDDSKSTKVEYDDTHVALLVDYLHFRDHWIPNEKQENVPEYPITDKIDIYKGPNADKNAYTFEILVLVNEFDC